VAEGNNRKSGAQTLERALDILEIIKKESHVEVKDLTKYMNMHRSSIYRIISVLEKRSYVRHNSINGKYYLGYKLLEMASEIDTHQNLVELAQPFMENLMHRTQETCHLMILDQTDVVYLAKVESPATIRMHSQVGMRRSAYCTAGGKVLLAHLPHIKQNEILEHVELKRITPHTITNVEEFKNHLHEVLLQGYAIDNQENEMGIVCLAAPIMKARGSVVAALTVSCPQFRTSSEKLDKFKVMVQETANQISHNIEYLVI